MPEVPGSVSQGAKDFLKAARVEAPELLKTVENKGEAVVEAAKNLLTKDNTVTSGQARGIGATQAIMAGDFQAALSSNLAPAFKELRGVKPLQIKDVQVNGDQFTAVVKYRQFKGSDVGSPTGWDFVSGTYKDYKVSDLKVDKTVYNDPDKVKPAPAGGDHAPPQIDPTKEGGKTLAKGGAGVSAKDMRIAKELAEKAVADYDPGMMTRNIFWAKEAPGGKLAFTANTTDLQDTRQIKGVVDLNTRKVTLDTSNIK